MINAKRALFTIIAWWGEFESLEDTKLVEDGTKAFEVGLAGAFSGFVVVNDAFDGVLESLVDQFDWLVVDLADRGSIIDGGNMLVKGFFALSFSFSVEFMKSVVDTSTSWNTSSKAASIGINFGLESANSYLDKRGRQVIYHSSSSELLRCSNGSKNLTVLLGE